MSLARALADWRALLGADAVAIQGEALARFTRDTSAFSQAIHGVVRPTSRELIPALVRIANRERVALYPISTGRNWGYGSANPARNVYKTRGVYREFTPTQS